MIEMDYKTIIQKNRYLQTKRDLPMIWTKTLHLPLVSKIVWKNAMAADIYLFKVKNGNKKKCERCSKLTIKTPIRRQWRRSGVFIVNFKHISHLFLLFVLFTLSKLMLAGMRFNENNHRGWNSSIQGVEYF